MTGVQGKPRPWFAGDAGNPSAVFRKMAVRDVHAASRLAPRDQMHVWLQGDVTDIEMSRTSDNVSAEDTDVDNGPWVTLDDGTGLLRVSLAPVCEAHAKHGEPWNATRGMYVLVLAVLEIEEPGQPAASAVFVKDLTGEPDRLAMWWCELMDAEQQSAVPSTHSGKADRQSA